ncbi:MAG: SH3 domain-containing protein [Terriglobales bacterium]
MKRFAIELCGLVTLLGLVSCVSAIASENQVSAGRAFPQSKAAIEKILKTLHSSISGRLPTLEGFAVPGERPLDRFQRAYYQCAVQVTAVPSGGSEVRVNAKITAWYRDPVPSRSGYQTLLSNGRIETDLLDQIADALGGSRSSASTKSDHAPMAVPRNSGAAVDDRAEISAPMPRLPENAVHGQTGLAQKNAGGSLTAETEAAEKHEQELASEARSLEEILQNQAHPGNLVAVKKTGAPILQSPNVDGKILFPATAGDEFEILDMSSNWVHVRISGISRGWIRRSEVEMPEAFSDAKPGAPSPDKAEEFRISNEQVAPFPGDWEPLRGKIVRIVTVQKTTEGANDPGVQARLKFAKAVFMKQYSDLANASDPPAGIVVIFDSEDGGMIAANLSTLKKWRTGSDSDEVEWKECFFDPPELAGK